MTRRTLQILVLTVAALSAATVGVMGLTQQIAQTEAWNGVGFAVLLAVVALASGPRRRMQPRRPWTEPRGAPPRASAQAQLFDEVERLQAQHAAEMDELRRRLREAHDRLEVAEAKAGVAEGSATDYKFKLVRKSFAQRFHPDRARADMKPEERRAREALFKEFWAEFERVDKA